MAGKLSRDDAEEVLFFGQYMGVPQPREPLDHFARRVQAAVDRQHAQRVDAIQHPPAPQLLTLKSWQLGFTAAGDLSAADKARAGALFLQLQAYGSDRLAASEWKRCLAAFDSAARWIDIARAREDEGRLVEANAALAAARWLDASPEVRAAAEQVTSARPAHLPARLREQPDRSVHALAFMERHWRAWDMKNYALLDVPSLLALESDESFSVRARVYRSLGQRPHPEQIQALHEGTLDPHPFARAQAIRSLGWCVDPTSVERLVAIEREDVVADVRRAAQQARHRIVGYWMWFGEWVEIMASPARVREVARELIDRGLPRMALDLLCRAGDEDHPAAASLFSELEALDADELWSARERDYGHWFADARADEASLRSAAAEPDALAKELESGDDDERMRALMVVSSRGRTELLDQVASMTDAAEPVGWGARRALRRLDRGGPAQRRAASWSSASRKSGAVGD